MNHRFQIDLRGIIELLSDHLYSGPEIFVRELLQNGVDAIRERVNADPAWPGTILFELHDKPGQPSRLLAADNGIGLTEAEVHEFLATIGHSSKRLGRGGRPKDYLGQFGIGILSCFVVSDEIIVISQSARPGHPPVEWKAKPDGTYTVRTLAIDVEPGTQVCLTAKPECASLFKYDELVHHARHFGRLLPYPVTIQRGKAKTQINHTPPPWLREFVHDQERRQAWLDFGKEIFEESYEDFIPLASDAGQVAGAAYIIRHPLQPGVTQTHRVYLKRMFLSDKVENVLPEWAIFVKAVVNVDDLRPTASRETLIEDQRLHKARETLGETLKQHLRRMAQERPEAVQKLLDRHDLAMKTLALHDDEFFQLCMDWFQFETNLGRMSFGQFLKHSPQVRYVSEVDGYRQIARIAAAQGIPLINAGHTMESDLLDKVSETREDLYVERIDPAQLARELDDVDAQEEADLQFLIEAARKVLRPYQCLPEIKRFQPVEIPVLFHTSQVGRFLRDVQRSQDVANPLFSELLGDLRRGQPREREASRLYFNFANPLVQRLRGQQANPLLRRVIEMLYVQALLLGHYPLSQDEMQLLNQGMMELIELGLRIDPSSHAPSSLEEGPP